MAEEGDFMVVRGKSGAGKTTLLRVIGLMEGPDKGEIRFFDKPVSGLNDEEKSKIRLYKIGYIFQFFNLMPTLTVLENMELSLALAGVKRGKG